LNFSQSRRSKKCETGKSVDLNSEDKSLSFTAVDKVGVGVSSQELKRREFLKLSAMVAGGGLAAIVLGSSLKPLNLIPNVAGQLLGGSKGTALGLVEPLEVSGSAILDPLSIPMFENQLTGPPPVYAPKVITSQGKVIRHEYTVAMASFTEQILPPSMNLLTTVWGYAGTANDAVTGASLGFVQSAPGPTFEAVRGIPVQVEWQNNISSPYIFAADPTIHWANPNNNPMYTSPFPVYPPGYPNAQSPVPLVTHLHGGENQSFYDGGPNAWFTTNGKHGPAYNTYEKTDSNAAVYYYPNTQQPTTLWYHDHALGLTRLNVMSGLAGFYLIRETNGSDKVAAMLPTGKYEMPLVIQDRTFNTDGSLNYPYVGSDSVTHPYWVNSFLGNAIMVNGKVWPNMNVDMGQYRFRILNGSNSRFYNIGFSNGMSFIQIGSDGGYLKTPATLSSLLMAPAERADIIVDFSGLSPGETVILQNSALIASTAEETQILGQIMQFTATSQTGSIPFNLAQAPSPFNPTLAAASFPTLPEAKKQRILTLFEVTVQNSVMVEALLDGQTWSAPISEEPELGTTEDWIIVNPTMDPHPIHLHLIQFQLVQRETFDATAYMEDWIALNGEPPLTHPTINVSNLDHYLSNLVVPPQSYEQGWKDTITVNSGEVVTLRVRFAQQDGSSFPFDATAGPGYVWHCHLLEHEDNEMMRPYKVTQKTSITLPLTISVAAVAAAALLSAYAYQRKRTKRPLASSASINKLNFLVESNEEQQPEEIGHEKADYQDLQRARGTSKGAQNGILIKSGDYLEIARKVTAVVFDKTGTLTVGRPSVTDMLTLNETEPDTIIMLAASVERGSEHPLAEAIGKEASARSLTVAEPSEFEAIPGKGVKAKIQDKMVVLGNGTLISEMGLDFSKIEEKINKLEADGKTLMFLVVDGRLVGVIAAADTLKEHSKETVVELKKMGIDVIMLTGDNERTAKSIAGKLSIENVFAEVLPQQKEAIIQKLQSEGKIVAMVGDGINDAPALSKADVGIAIGSGTDVAKETGGIVLVKDDLRDVVTAIKLSKRTVRKIKQNLFWAFVYNGALIPIAAGALVPLFGAQVYNVLPFLAAAAMAFSSVTVISNSLLLERFKPDF